MRPTPLAEFKIQLSGPILVPPPEQRDSGTVYNSCNGENDYIETFIVFLPLCNRFRACISELQ